MTGDQLDHTARQVRLPGGSVHQLKEAETRAPVGRSYWTACGGLLTAAQGAVLTTRTVSCSCCWKEAGRR